MHPLLLETVHKPPRKFLRVQLILQHHTVQLNLQCTAHLQQPQLMLRQAILPPVAKCLTTVAQLRANHTVPRRTPHRLFRTLHPRTLQRLPISSRPMVVPQRYLMHQFLMALPAEAIMFTRIAQALLVPRTTPPVLAPRLISRRSIHRHPTRHPLPQVQCTPLLTNRLFHLLHRTQKRQLHPSMRHRSRTVRRRINLLAVSQVT